jgi:hypothetical protein
LRIFVELLERDRGTPNALPSDMQDIETIEMMNVEQLATVTDRLLLRARMTNGRFSHNKQLFAVDHRRPSRPSIGQLAREIAPIPSLAGHRASQHADVPELTLFVRAKRFSTSTASAALLATLFAIAIAVTSVV